MAALLPAAFFRTDGLTGCFNFLGFIDALSTNSDGQSRQPYSLLFIDINRMNEINSRHGHQYGDSVLRWVGLLLQEESQVDVYRISGDEFAFFLAGGREEHVRRMHRIRARMLREGLALGIFGPAFDMALIHYPAGMQAGPEDILLHMSTAMYTIKHQAERCCAVFNAADFDIPPMTDRQWLGNAGSEVGTTHVRWVAHLMLKNVQHLALRLEEAQQAAYTDTISQLPNMNAALVHLDQALSQAQETGKGFSILLIDGDNLHRYNDVSYAVGDEMIRSMGVVLRANVRPDDFIARWRSGDEFLVILPQTDIENAMLVGTRLREAVKQEAASWRFPTSISIGASAYPQHGRAIEALIDQAEDALHRAKEGGKDQVVMA